MPRWRPTCKRALALAICAPTLGGGASTALGASSPRLTTDKGCYLVGQPVQITGTGFAPSRPYTVSVDGVYFGRRQTDSSGEFSASLRPGGLGAGVVQHVDQVRASDGSSSATATITLTRTAGARFLASTGNPNTLRAPFQVWGFSLRGAVLPVYVHYVSPRGRLRRTEALGHTGGQCGYLRTGSRRIFPFSPSSGEWTLQLDTSRRYAPHPSGPVARIHVAIT